MASRSVNKVILVGHLGKDAETRFTTAGAAVTNFTLATNRRWKDTQTGEWKEETDWHNVVLWRAENLANFLTKGKQVYVEGRLRTRSWDDKDGNKRYTTEVMADDVILLSGGGREGPSAGPEMGGYGDMGGDPGPAPYGGSGGQTRSGPVSMPRAARPGAQQSRPQPAAEPDTFGGAGDDDVPF
jgi:single-strand DNA-binding protein